MQGNHHHGSAAQAAIVPLTIVLFLTVGYMVVEIVGSFVTGSLALLADAGHVLIDVAGMSMAILAMRFASRPASPDKTYGYYRLEIIAALTNGMLMIGVGVYIVFEAIKRFTETPAVPGLEVLAFAVPGLVINLVSGYLLLEGQKTSLNLRGAFLEVTSDLAASLLVILAGLVIYLSGLNIVDPIASLALGAFILQRTWKLISEALHVLLEGAPRSISLASVREHILGVEGVESVHDLHVWNLTSGMNVMSAHVVVEQGRVAQEILTDLSSCLEDHFDIEHSTIQIEQPDRSPIERAGH
jgi:cobalt-zinc-cadmium efflux system protein